MDNTTAIKIALEKLRVQPEDAGAFVVIENLESGKLVQFTGSLDRPLLLDLPSQTLSEAEFYRAVAFSGDAVSLARNMSCLTRRVASQLPSNSLFRCRCSRLMRRPRLFSRCSRRCTSCRTAGCRSQPDRPPEQTLN